MQLYQQNSKFVGMVGERDTSLSDCAGTAEGRCLTRSTTQRIGGGASNKNRAPVLQIVLAYNVFGG